MNFTKVPNSFWDIESELGGAERRLLLRIIRLTEGFHQEWAEVGESTLLQQTGLSRAAVYRAKASLVGASLLEVRPGAASCAYRLGPRLLHGVSPTRPRLPSKTPSTPVDPLPSHPVDGGSHPVDGGSHPRDGSRLAHETPSRLTHETGSILKETSLKKSFKETSSSLDSSSTGDDDDVVKRNDLKCRLMEAQVSELQAHKFSRSCKPAAIETALLRASGPNIRNPAAYLARELATGGFAPPTTVDHEKALRQKRDQVARTRRAARESEAAAAESSACQAAAACERFERLSEPARRRILALHRDQAERDKFCRVPGWGPEHPLWRGLLAELMSIHAQAN